MPANRSSVKSGTGQQPLFLISMETTEVQLAHHKQEDTQIRYDRVTSKIMKAATNCRKTVRIDSMAIVQLF